ncbi:hypothetical protein [Ornithinimicrobium sufpigmenti]|uniref:hypothetical protein n=1 Tax=Ornithinimicrobium sufpigmenti TaxID=2508882 RepID=UPI0010364D3D|nr:MULTISPECIES: hypothetical protein [unclassified Ornithinimicrobium]
MSGPADRDPDEADPTGIRELLAGLPDPGPMPEDLVRRIEARLEVEQAAREQGATHPLGRHADRVVDLASERGRRRPGRTLAWLGAAAAGLVVTAAVVPQLVDGTGGGDSGTAAYYPTRGQTDSGEMHEDAAADGADDALADGDADGDADEGADDGLDRDAAGGDEDAEGGGAPSLSSVDEETDAAAADGGGDSGAAPSAPVPPLTLDGPLVLLEDLGLVEHEALTETMLQAVDEHDASSPTSPGLSPGSGVLTEGEATSCWRELAAIHTFDLYVAAPAQVVLPEGERQGEPVVALLGLHDDGSARSWVMPQECTRDPETLPLMQGQQHG